jgi:hypothetical protein
MRVLRRWKTEYDESLELIGERLRKSTVVCEPLPKRWVDLLRHLDELERNRSAPTQRDSIENKKG